MLHNSEMTIAQRRELHSNLSKLNDGSWQKIASENDFERQEVFFWFLVDDAQMARRSYDRIIAFFLKEMAKFPLIKFTLSFNSLSSNKQVILESLNASDIRDGRVPTNFGLNPYASKRQEFTVFDRDF